MKLLLVRHGNTFGPDDTPVWVGACEDYPLVEKGLQQSRDMGGALMRIGNKPDRIIAGPLLRTKTGAELIAEETGFSGDIVIDERLKEIDYGSWGGKSDAYISDLYGPSVIDDWRERTIRPEGCDWSPSDNELRKNAVSLLNEVQSSASEDETVLLVTSNGILRFYHAVLYEGASMVPSAKVKTGHLCMASGKPGALKPDFWNRAPKDI